MKKFVYDLIYSDPDTHYGHTNHGKPFLNTILEFKPESWLDVGCGFNEMIKEVRDNYIQDSWGIDFSCPGADQQCDILDLPFPDNRWDFISAFDVMEHIYPDKVSIALEEMRRVSKRFVFTIAFTKAHLEYKGVNAHPTVWSREVWYETIENAGGKIWDISKYEHTILICDNQLDEFFIGEWI